MEFQRLIKTTKLVNASTFPIRGLKLNSPYGCHELNVDPLGVVEVPIEWTEKGQNYQGKAILKSTIEQYAPALVPEKDPRIKEARDVMEKGEYTPTGSTKPVKADVYPIPPRPEPAPQSPYPYPTTK